MSRYIDADKLEEITTDLEIATAEGYTFKCRCIVASAWDDIPTADVVEIVRCKDCGWYIVDEFTKSYKTDRRREPSFCGLHGRYRKKNWFCADGERRTE